MIRTPTASRASDAQLAADNYRKPDRFRWNGLQIVIETPKGARRRPGWPRMSCAYGDIKRTTGADGDAVDVFVGPNRASELVVIIDQVTPGGRFDEHKVLIAFNTTADAVKAYRRCYSRGWRVGPVSTMTVGQFRAWLIKGNQAKRVAGQVHRFSTWDDYADRYDTQLSFTWDEAKHPRDERGRFAEGDSVTVPTYGNVEGEWKQTGTQELTIDASHQHEGYAGRKMAWLRRPDGSKMARMPVESIGHFQDDLTGKVTAPPHSDPSINAVISGKAKFLGKGDDGLAFDTGDGNVVKVSTTVPYHPENDAHRTPAEAVNMMRKSAAANQAMIDAGHGGAVLPQKYIEHGDKAFTVMPKVDTEATYTKEQLDDFRGKMEKLHADGYRIGDTIQTGLAEDGTIRIFDTGKAHKSDKQPGETDYSLEDEQGYVRGLYHDAKVYDHAGEDDKYRKLGKMTDDYIEMSEETGKPIGPPSTMRRLHEQYRDMVANDHDALGFIGDDHFANMARAESLGFKMPEGWKQDAAAHEKEWNSANSPARPRLLSDLSGPSSHEHPPAGSDLQQFATTCNNLQQFAALCSSWAEAVDFYATQLAFNWDESQHPRKPSGSPAGGEFTATDSTPAGDGTTGEKGPTTPIKSRPVPDKPKAGQPEAKQPGTARARHYPGGLAKVVKSMAPDAADIEDRRYYISSGARNARYTLRVKWMDTVGDGEGGSIARPRDNHVDTLAADYGKAEEIARKILGSGATLYAEQFGIGKAADKRDADVFKFGHHEGKRIGEVLEKDPAYIQSIWMGGWFNASSKHKTFRKTLEAAGGGPIPEVAAFRASKEKSWDDPEIQKERERTTGEVFQSLPAVGDATAPKEYKKRATTRFAKGIDWLEDKLRPMYSDTHVGPDGGLANVRKELERWEGIAIYKGGEKHERSDSVSWHDPFWHGIGDQARRYLAKLPTDLVDSHNQKTRQLESKAWEKIGKLPADEHRKAEAKAKREGQAQRYDARADYDPMTHRPIIGPQTFGDAVDACFDIYDTQPQLPGWRTIGANKTNPKGQQGGTPVYMDTGGNIAAGPAKLVGHAVDAIGGKKEAPQYKPGQRFAEAVGKFFEKKKAEQKAGWDEEGAPKMSEEEKQAELALRKKLDAKEMDFSEFREAKAEAHKEYNNARKNWEQHQLDAAVAEITPRLKELKGQPLHQQTWADASLSAAIETDRQLATDLKKWGPAFAEIGDARERGDYLALDKLILAMEKRRGYKALQKRYPAWTGKEGNSYSIGEALSEYASGDKGKLGYRDIQSYDIREKHEEAVKKAIADGKEVPPDVLNDYAYTEWMGDDQKNKVRQHKAVTDEEAIRKGPTARESAHNGRRLREQSNAAVDTQRAALASSWEIMDKAHGKMSTDAWNKYYEVHKQLRSIDKQLDGPQPADQTAEQLATLQTYRNSLKSKSDELYDARQKLRQQSQTIAIKAVAGDLRKLAEADGRPVHQFAEGDRDSGVTFDLPANAAGPWPEKFAAAQSFLNLFVNPELAGKVKVKIADKAGRANASKDTINLHPGDSISTIIHEVGHVLDHLNGDKIGQRSKAFLNAQVQAHPVKHLGRGYRTHEVASKDGFVDDYTGKAYPHQGSSEILSMGLQSLYDDATRFARDSPDHFNYTIAAIRGYHDEATA